MYPLLSITKPEPAPSTGTGSIQKSYSVALVSTFATAGEACRYIFTFNTSSLLSAASRSAKLAFRIGASDLTATDGTASTLTGPRGPHLAPAQYATRIKSAIAASGRSAEPLFPNAIGPLPFALFVVCKKMIAQLPAA